MVSVLKVQISLVARVESSVSRGSEVLSWCNSLDLSQTDAHKFRLWIDLYILLLRFPLFSLLLQPEDSHTLATLDTTIDGVAPSVAITSKRLPVSSLCKLWRGQVTLIVNQSITLGDDNWLHLCDVMPKPVRTPNKASRKMSRRHPR